MSAPASQPVNELDVRLNGAQTPLLLKEGRLAKRVGVVLKNAKLPLMAAKHSLIGALRGSFRTTPALRAFPSFKRSLSK
jgi:hypothetical protein